MTNRRKLLGFFVIVLIFGIAFSLFANDKTNADGNLVLETGWAWTDYHEHWQGRSDGYIFRSDGTVLSINNYNVSWVIDDATTYSTSDGNIDIDGQTGSYSISVDTLVLFQEMIFKKTNLGTIR